MCLDALKITSDDSVYNEMHILFLLNKYRSLFLQQRYSDVRKPMPESNYQTICLDLIQDSSQSIDNCNQNILKSKDKIPSLLNVGNAEVFPLDYYLGNITLVSYNRMKFVGHNKWLKNIIYCSIGPDNYLYFKSAAPTYSQLEKVQLKGVFENPEEASKLTCNESNICDAFDKEYPIEEALASQLIEAVVKFMTSGLYKPEDTENNASDDMSSMVAFIRKYMKSDLQKQIEG